MQSEIDGVNTASSLGAYIMGLPCRLPLPVAYRTRISASYTSVNRACELHLKSSKAKAEYIVSSSSSWWVVSHSLSVYSRLSRSDHSSSTSASRIYHFGRVAWVLCGDFPHDFLSCQWIHFSLLFHSFDAPCRCQYYFHENNAVYHSRLRLLTMWQGLEVCLNNSDLTSNIH